MTEAFKSVKFSKRDFFCERVQPTIVTEDSMHLSALELTALSVAGNGHKNVEYVP